MADPNTCGSLFKQIHDSLERRANNAMRPYGLTMAQFGVLLAVGGAEGGVMSLKELEGVLRVAQSTTAGIVSRLEQKGFLEGFGDPEDKRVKRVRITDKGRECCAVAEGNMAETEKAILSGLTEGEREALKALLRKVAQTLR